MCYRGSQLIVVMELSSSFIQTHHMRCFKRLRYILPFFLTTTLYFSWHYMFHIFSSLWWYPLRSNLNVSQVCYNDLRQKVLIKIDIFASFRKENSCANFLAKLEVYSSIDLMIHRSSLAGISDLFLTDSVRTWFSRA